MSRPAIEIENLGKAYRIGLKEEVPDTLVSAAAGWLRSPIRNWDRLRKLNTFEEKSESDDIVWALKDVSFSVNEGEVVGVIGRNGAGKSTLLKILSRITEPTSGRAIIRGRVSSLLEVGTGFHPELTGRENVYMNGTILGMTKREIDRKFDEIVDFSGVEKFLDTPVKRYSSGMKVRLAFAVAAHLEPEILIIDEVLAVGDAEFQRKCLGKMQDVAGQGRTVLFVSHNMAAVRNLCSRAIRLCDGLLTFDGMPEEAIDQYLVSGTHSSGKQDFSDPSLKRKGSGKVRFTSAEIQTFRGSHGTSLPMGEGFKVRMGVESTESVENTLIGIGLFDASGARVCGLNSSHTADWTFSLRAGQTATYVCSLKSVNLGHGRYHLNLILKQALGNQVYDSIESALILTIEGADIYNTGKIPVGNNIVFLRPDWSEEEPNSQPLISFSEINE
ncbi:ABC transporter ATP-binding protein [Thalassoroseus pseudoceratinae]|uniref:ABC transporter ATP-binding protein n=1 Tax=Thalassoroseus pseudoceratinae TaxID=2713176 RepID=UPI0014233CB2|nr:ABC transporter ATP-binding protein [Thalassoroseus pseudoceratinae]